MDSEVLFPEAREIINGEVEWQPLALTLVEYPKGDLLGKFFAFLSLSPFGIGAGFVALILFRRDLHTEMKFRNKMVEYVTDWVLGTSHQIAPPHSQGPNHRRGSQRECAPVPVPWNDGDERNTMGFRGYYLRPRVQNC